MPNSDSTHLFPIPDSPLARAAEALAVSYESASVLAHSRRTYHYGQAALRANGRVADQEAMYVASMLHDVALGTLLDDGRTPFEQLSAQAARDLVAQHRADLDVATLVHDAVALHLDLATGQDRRPEVAGVHLGALIDLLGIGLDQLPREFVEAVLANHPREGVAAHLRAVLKAEATAKPNSRIATLIREFGLLDLIAHASFPAAPLPPAPLPPAQFSPASLPPAQFPPASFPPASGVVGSSTTGLMTPFGSATVLLQVGPFRILTDPVLESASLETAFEIPKLGLSIPLHRRTGPAASPPLDPDLDLDVVLLTHDHPDHLDGAGRAALRQAGTILTTRAAAARLTASGLEGVIGLAPGDSHTLTRAGSRLCVTATPAWHGPAHLLPVIGEVIGFLVTIDGLDGSIYVTGDTLVTPELAPQVFSLVGGRPIGTMVVHLGAAQFELTGTTRFTMDATEAAELCLRLDARTVVPVHEDDWDHFTGSAADTEAAFARAGVTDRLVRVAPGESAEVAATDLRTRRRGHPL